ncbi:BCCT family transporter [Volucribacter psittacicida]|nr:BCCT family transporter [Volucribacter psittacicida]
MNKNKLIKIIMRRFPSSIFNLNVVLTSLCFCGIIIGLVVWQPQQALQYLAWIREFIFTQFGWFYVLTSAGFIFFLIFLALTRYGDIKLGDNDDEPEFSLGSWFALLFTAGMGIGIVFLGVAEPLSHFLDPLSHKQLERNAVFQSIFHWSVNAWAIYGVIALAIAYFGFRYKLPLSLRSCFYPFFKQKIDGKLGDMIDILGLCTSLFGIICTLAYSAIRLTMAFPEGRLTTQVILAGVFIIALLVSMKRLANGLRLVSELNLVLALLLMLFVLLVGPTAYLLSAFTENIGYYLSSFVNVGFRTYVYQPENIEWFKQWTILYWAWWFSWAPAFGIFIARISKGRTVREFIFGILVVPSLFFILWFTVFGNGVIWINEYIAQGQLKDFIDQSGKLLFAFLSYLPLSTLSQFIALAVISLFFITTIDFGIYILNNISSKDKSLVAPRWQAIMWGAILATVTFILFEIGGTEALQATMLIFSLPFALLMIVMAMSLLKGLRLDYYYHNSEHNSQHWRNEDWRGQLTELLTQHNKQDAMTYLKHIALPAMRELRQELIGIYELNVHLETDFEQINPYILFIVQLQNEQQFEYKLELEKSINYEQEKRYQILAKTNINESAYEIQYLSKNGLIADILQQYENYLAQDLEIENI